MSRHGYTDDIEDVLAYGRCRAQVKNSIKGKRGQALLRELAEALDSMPEKKLYAGSFATAEGQFCTLGVLGEKRGTKMDDLGDEDYCNTELVAERFGISNAMASEIMFMNDEYCVDEYKWVEVEICGPVRPYYPDFGSHIKSVRVYNEKHAEERWQKMRDWVMNNISCEDSA